MNTEFDTTASAAYLFDAVKLYATALDKHLRMRNADEPGDPVLQGREIVKHMLNDDFKSILGFSMRIDENGDAGGNYTVLAMQKVNVSDKGPQSLEYYPHEEAMIPVAHFVRSMSSGDTDASGMRRRQVQPMDGELEEYLCCFNAISHIDSTNPPPRNNTRAKRHTLPVFQWWGDRRIHFEYKKPEWLENPGKHTK